MVVPLMFRPGMFALSIDMGKFGVISDFHCVTLDVFTNVQKTQEKDGHDYGISWAGNVRVCGFNRVPVIVWGYSSYKGARSKVIAGTMPEKITRHLYERNIWHWRVFHYDEFHYLRPVNMCLWVVSNVNENSEGRFD